MSPSRCTCAPPAGAEHANWCPLFDHHPPGEPPAAALEDELADLVVVDGPNAGQVWTYEASHGGYVIADPEGRAADETICDSPAMVMVHTGAEVVRPVEEL